MDADRSVYKVQQGQKEEWLIYWGRDEGGGKEERLSGKNKYSPG